MGLNPADAADLPPPPQGERTATPRSPPSAANDTVFDELLDLMRREFGGLPSSDDRLMQLVDALQASEIRARRLFETAPHALLVVDAKGCVERANHRAELLFDRPVTELLGLPVEALLPAGLIAPPQAAGDAQEPAPRVMSARSADGSELPVQVHVGLLDEGGRGALVVSLQDLRLQAAAQQVLAEHHSELERRVEERTVAAQQAETQLRLILESTADGLYGVDARGFITFVNPAACEMLGVRAEALMGRSALQLLQPAQADGRPFDPDENPLQRTLRTGAATRVERALYRRPDGRELPVVYEVRAMWQHGRIVGAVVSFSDITERLAAEAARDAALTEARRLAQVRTEFLANMSHEIRTPLNAVLGLAEIGARGDRDRAPEEAFRMILDAGQVLLGVVNDILDFAKIEAGKLRVESQLFDLGPVIDRAVAMINGRAFAKGLHLRVDEAADLPRKLRGDPLRLTQVLGNLLSNAVKFTEEGTIELRVWRDLHDLWFSVSDSGIGISPEQLPRLFTPFEQADSSTTRRYGGSGLGLVISRHLMELMNGSISARSILGEGSTFSVRLPLVDAVPGPCDRCEGEIVLAGLIDVDHVPDALACHGLRLHCVPTPEAFEAASRLVVLDIEAVQHEPVRDAAIAALQRGQRIALLTHPLAAELPDSLRGKVVLLEHPLRARHVLACLSEAPAPEPGPTGGRLSGLCVLAAEDNEVNALVLEAVLRVEGAQLKLVETGRAAVEELRRAGAGHYDLVLTDIQMPEMDGYAATRQMLKIDRGLPVVGLTAHAMVEERDRCLAAGMVDHVAKPIDLEQLVAVVLRHARRRDAAAP
jgi:PAS domain S-box-containing protein